MGDRNREQNHSIHQNKGASHSAGGYSRPLGPGGGFGQGGYGRFGTERGRPRAAGIPGTWGNEPSGALREDLGESTAKLASEELAASRMDEEGGGSRPDEEQSSDDQARGRWQREAITAGDVMTADIMAVSKTSSVQEVAAIMQAENCGVVPVVDRDQRLIGMVTDRDIVVRACAAGLSPQETRASEVMTSVIEAITSDEPIRNVLALMGERQIRRIPVVDRDDRLVGIISMGDIANRADYDEALEDTLERVSAKQPPPRRPPH